MDNQQEQGYSVINAASGKPLRLAMQEVWLTGTVLPFGARLVVRHCFESQGKKPLEAIYAFALPRDAAMRRFRVVGEGFQVESSLKPLEQAREAYENGLEEGHLSALAQQYQDGLVNLSLGNIRPGERVTVYIELAAGVSCTDTGFRFRFPFTLAPCYHPAAAYGTTDEGDGEIGLPEELFGDLILPPWRRDAAHLHRVGFDLSLALPGGEVEIASPSHPLSVRYASPACARVALATEGDLPNRDLVLDIRHAVTAPRVFSGLDGAGKGRFAVVVPSTAFDPPRGEPKHVVFLIDHSGSMNGKPFHQAKQAALACIAALGPEDCFGVVFFESSTTAFAEQCVEAVQEQRDAARKFVNGMQIAGGTELESGIAAATRLLPEGGDILLLTDGQVYETGTIIARARKAGVRVHCLGIGSASQDRFLALLARQTGGTSHFATARERVDVAALRVFNAIGVPAAKGLEAQITGLKDACLVPEMAPMARVNEPVVVFGSCTSVGEGLLRLAWDTGSLEIPVAVASEAEAAAGNVGPEATPSALGETLKLVQGARLVTDGELSDEEATTRRAKARVARQQAVRWQRLAEEYGLANPAMSLVAVIERQGDQPGGVPVTRVVPVGMPEDTDGEAYFGMVARMIGSAGVVASCKPGPGMPLLRSFAIEENFQESLYECCEPAKAEKDADRLLDILFETTAALEADGGLPGAMTEERIVRTLAAAVALYDYDRNDGEPSFRAHLTRMMDFLRRQDTSTLSPKQAALLQQLFEAVDQNHLPAGPWAKEYLGFSRKPDAGALWKWLEKIV